MCRKYLNICIKFTLKVGEMEDSILSFIYLLLLLLFSVPRRFSSCLALFPCDGKNV